MASIKHMFLNNARQSSATATDKLKLSTSKSGTAPGEQEQKSIYGSRDAISPVHEHHVVIACSAMSVVSNIFRQMSGQHAIDSQLS